MEINFAIDYLKLVVKDKLTLKHYDRRVELAQEYKDYRIGNLDARLKRIISRENETEFQQRTNITNHISKSILNSALNPYQKASRVNPIVDKIDFTTSDFEERRRKVNEILSKYNGEKSLKQYLELMVVEFNFNDPNAFLITEFQPNDVKNTAKPYPFIALSYQVVDYNYINGKIEYVIVKLPIKYKEEQKEKDGFKYTMYLGNQTVVFEQIGIDYILQTKEEKYDTEKGNEYYKYITYQVKADSDPELYPAAVQFGYIIDPETNYETYLGIFDCALPLLRKTLKTNSELDQSMAMMAFPQRYRYVPKCNADGCHKGSMPDGSDCVACGGTGKAKIHKGSQDIQEFDLPNDPEEIFDLAKLAYDHSPNIDLLKFQDEYIKALKVDIHTTIFNNDIFTKPTITQTATESNIQVDNMNDTLYSFCRRYSQIWQHSVYFAAVFTDNVKKTNEGSDIIIEHKFPKDLKFKTLGELMLELKSAYDSKSSVSTISAIENDINEILYSDRPDELKKINTQQSFNPFKGYSPDDIRYFFASGLTTKFNQTLYANYPNIWLELEKESKDVWVYDLESAKIYDLLTKKVEIIKKKIELETPKLVSKLDFGQSINTNMSLIYDDQIHLNFKTDKKSFDNNGSLVVPVTLMVEGVHNGSHGPILHKIDELGKFTSSWDGIPITINHPSIDGKFISANKPEILKKSIGRIFNTRVEGEKLVSEAWIDIDTISDELRDKIKKGKEIEVSIGAYPEYKREEGFYNDEFYESIAVNYRPDHLAILIDQEGACSCKDKCGINVNGGEGSGNFDHEGRAGEIGGSSSSNENELSVKDVLTLDKYGSDDSIAINNRLRNGAGTESDNKFSKNMSEALKKIPKYEGEVYRAMSIHKNNEEFLNSVKVGSTFIDKGFMSTSKDKKIAQEFLGKGQDRYFFKIKSKEGRDFDKFTSDEYKGENEVVFDKNSKFKVKALKTTNVGNVRIHVVEMEQ